MKSGIEQITAERKRQIESEGHSIQADCGYKKGTLAMAGITYASVATSGPTTREAFRQRANNGDPVLYYQWDISTLKMGKDDRTNSRVRELVKAGALIAAEIDALQQLEAEASQSEAA